MGRTKCPYAMLKAGRVKARDQEGKHPNLTGRTVHTSMSQGSEKSDTEKATGQHQEVSREGPVFGCGHHTQKEAVKCLMALLQTSSVAPGSLWESVKASLSPEGNDCRKTPGGVQPTAHQLVDT